VQTHRDRRWETSAVHQGGRPPLSIPYHAGDTLSPKVVKVALKMLEEDLDVMETEENDDGEQD
jgi:hypothetical protein